MARAQCPHRSCCFRARSPLRGNRPTRSNRGKKRIQVLVSAQRQRRIQYWSRQGARRSRGQAPPMSADVRADGEALERGPDVQRRDRPARASSGRRLTTSACDGRVRELDAADSPSSVPPLPCVRPCRRAPRYATPSRSLARRRGVRWSVSPRRGVRGAAPPVRRPRQRQHVDRPHRRAPRSYRG